MLVMVGCTAGYFLQGNFLEADRDSDRPIACEGLQSDLTAYRCHKISRLKLSNVLSKGYLSCVHVQSQSIYRILKWGSS